MLDGRVKTLHPSIHGGILARRDLEHHMEALDKHKIGEHNLQFCWLSECQNIIRGKKMNWPLSYFRVESRL